MNIYGLQMTLRPVESRTMYIAGSTNDKGTLDVRSIYGRVEFYARTDDFAKNKRKIVGWTHFQMTREQAQEFVNALHTAISEIPLIEE